MISATAKLILAERAIILECSISPDNIHIAPVYQDFLDKYEGPISVDVDVIQDRDSSGVVLHPGHAVIRMRLQDADDVQVMDLASVPEISEVGTNPTLSESVVPAEASESESPSSSLRNEGSENDKEASSGLPDLMAQLKAMMAEKNKDLQVVKL